MTRLYLFSTPPAWWTHLRLLEEALDRRDGAAAGNAYASVLGELAEAGHADLAAAAAELLLYTSTPFSRAAMAGSVPTGLERAMGADVGLLTAAVRRTWSPANAEAAAAAHPELRALAARPAGAIRGIADALEREDAASVLERLTQQFRRNGDGPLAKHLAFRWTGGDVEAIAHPSMPRMERLVGLSRQLDQLGRNTEAFLADRPAHHTLLYGPRGSGKSTAVRALLPKHHAAGLRLVEIAPDDLEDLPAVLERLRGRPHRYVLFVDDLSFDRGDTAYRPLKTLLEGSLVEPPTNSVLYATSNRRHLVREGFGDRPDPLDDDVHAWDTQQERLALSDRFGLAITFPDASQRRYLEIVHGLVADAGIEPVELEERAIRFAEWGNGYSGRTAEQFVRTLRSSGAG